MENDIPVSVGKEIERILLGDRRASRIEAMMSPTSQFHLDMQMRHKGEGVPGLWPKTSPVERAEDPESGGN